MILIKYLIWIDKSIDNGENQGYIKIMKDQFSINCIQFKDVESAFQYMMNSLRFKVIALMVSGSLFSTYIQAFDNYKKKLTTIPLTIIFTSSVSKFKGYCKYKDRIEHIFYNPGGVHDTFGPVKEYIKKLMKTEIPKIPCNPKDNPNNYEKCYSFEYIKNSSQLIYPYLYNDIISNKEITDDEIYNFNYLLVEKFGNKMGDLIEPLTLCKKIPSEILSKFYVYAYSLETPFYRNLNWDLMMLNGNNYYPFIKTLYKGMGDYCFKDLSVRLYRGARMSEDELNKMKEVLNQKETYDNKMDKVIQFTKTYSDINFIDKKNIIPKILFYSRCFLSFSRNLSVANGFSGNVLLELHLDFLDLNEIQSNSDISKFSAFSSEEEIVFYPFSSFSIEKIYKENGKTKIILECLGKYKDSIKDAINKYKNDYGSFENQISYSNFYSDIKNSKFLKLEDCLQVVYTKITGKPYSEYKNEGNNNSINNNNNSNNYNNNSNKNNTNDNSNEQDTVKNFVEDIFNWALNHK